jgi:hypothetical protein
VLGVLEKGGREDRGWVPHKILCLGFEKGGREDRGWVPVTGGDQELEGGVSTSMGGPVWWTTGRWVGAGAR